MNEGMVAELRKLSPADRAAKLAAEVDAMSGELSNQMAEAFPDGLGAFVSRDPDVRAATHALLVATNAAVLRWLNENPAPGPDDV